MYDIKVSVTRCWVMRKIGKGRFWLTVKRWNTHTHTQIDTGYCQITITIGSDQLVISRPIGLHSFVLYIYILNEQSQLEVTHTILYYTTTVSFLQSLKHLSNKPIWGCLTKRIIYPKLGIKPQWRSRPNLD